MAYAFGDMVRLETTVKVGGVATDAATVVLTILLPDGTITAPITPGNPSTGLYRHDYPTTMAGRHVARWVTTAPVSVDEETFDVAQQWAEAGIISLADAKVQLKVSTASDEEIAGYLRAVTVICERHVGAIVRVPYTEKHDGGYAIALNRRPILSIASVVGVAWGVTQNVADLDPDLESGTFERLDGLYMPGPVRVTYVAGRAEVPPNVRTAALIILKHLWQTRLGGPVQTATVEEQMPRVYGTQVPSGFAIPNRAIELLGQQVGGFA